MSTARGFAKVNLGLWITGVQDDGKHQLLTLFTALSDLYDEVDLNLARVPGEGRITCTDAKIPLDSKNIIHTAMTFCGVDPADYDVSITKRIPIAAGLAGGSADAAAVILLLGNPHKSDIQQYAQIGADVPFAVRAAMEKGNFAAVGRGVGDALSSVDLPTLDLQILPQDCEISTAVSYKTFDDHFSAHSEPHAELELSELLSGLHSLDLAKIKKCLNNDLQKTAYIINPELEVRINGLNMAAGAKEFYFMTGSGPTIVKLTLRQPKSGPTDGKMGGR
ncbi:MAG: hypothetical protein LBQ41_01000 [Candidatus Ancillula sp.]|jgi:4-diphosphocytidyl-2-C-methyl-D-erythritol kinase|nr:hypothetical protein [Candidatus Ancillula sp.]